MVIFDIINYEELKKEYFSIYRYKTLSECLNHYVMVFGEYGNIPEFKPIYYNLQRIVNQLLEAEEFFKLGFIGRCYNNIFSLLFDKDGLLYSNLIVNKNNIRPCPVFYRMREMDTFYLLKKEEMLHIPFNKRDKVGNQRFSLSGFPCLYLGSSAYLCWEELNRPNHLKANVSAFIAEKDIRFIDLTFPDRLEKEIDVYKLALVFACSLKRQTVNHRIFKEEYIIPQALLHSLMEYNYNNGQNTIDGILYISTCYKTECAIFDDIKLFYNLVIPTQQYKSKSVDLEKEYCEELCSLFQYTEPISINQLQINQPAFIRRYRENDECNYHPSDFWLLECYLQYMLKQ